MFSWIPWTLCGVLTVTVTVLLIKIRLMKKGMDEICEGLESHLSTDTNQLISVSSGDKHLRRLAERISKQLIILRKQRRQYVSGDKELKEAVTNISHDLRTPLTAIWGYLDLLERQETSEEVARYLGHIRNRAEALRQLTEELFRYSVILSTAGELTPEACDIRGILEESLLSYYAALTERGIEPEITMPEIPVTCMVDKKAMTRIVGNLISNALKYSDGDLAVTLSETGELIFENTAQGLDEVQVGRLFDRFYTVEAARTATGLGLSIAKSLTEQMGGRIKAEYSDGKLKIILNF